ncbi:MAG: ATP-binding cassette domain-containing protein [Acidimicrobiales bacterium]
MERLDRVDRPWQPWQLEFTIGEVERSGDLVAELASAVVTQGDFVLGPVSIEVLSGQRILLEGANGAGKSTLLRALIGKAPLAAGTQRLGRSVVLGELDQGRERLETSGKLLDRFIEDTGLDLGPARSILAKFGLGTEHVSRPSSALSPGEQTRAVLAAFQASGVNTVILDEPTNHLDLEAIEQLEAALSKFAGTLIVVSHDRAFVDSLALTHRFFVADGTLG